MKKIILSFAIFLFVSTSFSQNVGIGTTQPDASAKLEITSTNSGFLLPRMTTTQRDAIPSPAIGLIIFNSTTNTLEIFTGSWGSVTFSSPQVKKLFGAGNYDEGYDVQQTTDGGYIIVGMAAFTANPGTLAGLIFNGGQDGVVIKTDAYGNVQWQKIFGGSMHDYFMNISLTVDGGYILGGRSYSSNTGTFSGITGNGGSDFWVLKLNATGNIQWQKLFGGSANETVHSISQTNDGGYIVAGSSASSNSGTLTGLLSNGGATDGCIIKLDAAGSVQWQKLLGGTAEETVTSIRKTIDGGYIAAGYSLSSNTGTLIGATNNGSSDFWILKLSGNGATQWQKLFGGTGNDFSYDVLQTKDGGYITTGSTSSTNSGTLTSLVNNGGSDCWILKLDDFGNFQWQRLFGGISGDLIQSIKQTLDGGYIMGGYSQSSNTGTLTGILNNGSYDGWVIKIDVSGGLQWQKLYGGNLDDYFTNVRQTSDGGYILSGMTSSTNSGNLVGYNNNGNSDLWLLKLDKSGNQ